MDGSSKERAPSAQKIITGVIIQLQRRTLQQDLQRSGNAGRLVQAQLHSQSGPGARMAWTHGMSIEKKITPSTRSP